MKKTKRHSFKHRDPEKEQYDNKASSNKAPGKTRGDANIPLFVFKDLKKTGVVITVFVLVLLLVLLVQSKTDFLKPILRFFNL